MEPNQRKPQEPHHQSLPRCNVNTTFNFAVGILAIAAALSIAYLIVVFW